MLGAVCASMTEGVSGGGASVSPGLGVSAHQPSADLGRIEVCMISFAVNSGGMWGVTAA